MIKGQMDIQRFDARGLTKAEIDAGIQAMGLDRFLETIHKNGQWQGHNRILIAMPRCAYYGNGHSTTEGGWLNAPSSGSWYNQSSRPMLWAIVLTSLSSEPDVDEWYSIENSYNWTPPNAVATQYGAVKRFNTDSVIDVEVFKDPSGREAAIIRNRFMYYPGECTSSVIRSIEVYGSENNSWYGGYYESKARVARWRIKDAGGVPVTLTKLDQEVLLIQYSLIMYSR